MAAVTLTGPADAPVHGTESHLPGHYDSPLCDSKSYVGFRWYLAADLDSTTCKHCRNMVEASSTGGGSTGGVDNQPLPPLCPKCFLHHAGECA